MTNIYTPQQQRILLITSLIIIGGFIIFGLSGYISAFLGQGFYMLSFGPGLRPWPSNDNWNRTLVTTLLIIFSVVVIIMPFLTLSLLLIDRIQYYSQHTEDILNLARKAEELTGYKITSQQNIQRCSGRAAPMPVGYCLRWPGEHWILSLLLGLMLFTLYFMFVQQESFQKGLHKYLPFKRDTQKELGESLKNNVNANVSGQAMVSLVQGVLTGVTLWIFGVPDALFWGTVGFFLAFIPVLGTPLVWGPAGLIQLSQGNTSQGIGILVVGVVVIINIDNLLRIMLAKRMGDIHPLVTLAGIVLGVPIFGILGLVIGPLLLSYFIVLIQVFERENRQEKGVKERKRVNELYINCAQLIHHSS